MKKFLLFHVALLALTSWIMGSCDVENRNTSEITIVGAWQLKKEFTNQGENTPLKEFPLSECDKKTTLEVLENGRFLEKSYYDDLTVRGECLKDTEETMGRWKRGSGDVFFFAYYKSEAILFSKSEVKIENGDLIITSTYNDPELGYGTILKFIYTKM